LDDSDHEETYDPKIYIKLKKNFLTSESTSKHSLTTAISPNIKKSFLHYFAKPKNLSLYPLIKTLAPLSWNTAYTYRAASVITYGKPKHTTNFLSQGQRLSATMPEPTSCSPLQALFKKRCQPPGKPILNKADTQQSRSGLLPTQLA
jgi:hypothetical protein